MELNIHTYSRHSFSCMTRVVWRRNALRLYVRVNTVSRFMQYTSVNKGFPNIFVRWAVDEGIVNNADTCLQAGRLQMLRPAGRLDQWIS